MRFAAVLALSAVAAAAGGYYAASRLLPRFLDGVVH